jgi:hypothetical protein
MLGSTQPTNQWVTGAPSLRVKWLGHVANHPHPSSVVAKTAWSYTSTLPHTFMVCARELPSPPYMKTVNNCRLLQ